MRRTVFVILAALALAVLWTNGTEVSAACPTASCASGGTNNDDICEDNYYVAPTRFGCTFVATYSDGSVHTTVAFLSFDCAGNVTVFKSTSNSNGSGTTFSDWASQGTTGTYCLNADDTGYIFPPTAGSCPIAIVLDSYDTELRTLDSTQNRAQVGVCEDLP